MSISSTTKKIVKMASAAAVVGFAVTPLMAGSASASTTASPLTSQQIASHSQPAVDLVVNQTSGQLSYYQPRLNDDALVQWALNDQQVVGGIQNRTLTDYSLAVLMLNELETNPSLYLANGSGSSVNVSSGDQGAGFSVTANGYLLTNAHVVQGSASNLASDYFGQLSTSQLDAIFNDFGEQFSGIVGVDGRRLNIPNALQQNVMNLVLNFMMNSAEVQNLQQSVSVYPGDSGVQETPYPAQIVAAGNVYPGNDVALLKIDASGLPTLPLAPGSAALPSTGSNVYAIGFPADATFSSTIATTQLDSTFTQGVVSNLLNSSGGNFQWIENTATINHGSSGGPLLNQYGQVIGITTATDDSLENEGSANGGTLFYALPIQVAEQLMSSNDVAASPNPDQKYYDAGVDAIAAQNRSEALSNLDHAQRDGFTTPYLQQEINGALPLPAPPRSSGLPLPMIGAGLAGAAVVGGVVWRRRKSSKQSAPVSGDHAEDTAAEPGVPWAPAEPPVAPPVTVASAPSSRPYTNGNTPVGAGSSYGFGL